MPRQVATNNYDEYIRVGQGEPDLCFCCCCCCSPSFSLPLDQSLCPCHCNRVATLPLRSHLVQAQVRTLPQLMKMLLFFCSFVFSILFLLLLGCSVLILVVSQVRAKETLVTREHGSFFSLASLQEASPYTLLHINER